MKGSDNTHGEKIKVFLSQDELFTIDKLLGRNPNQFELNMFAAMWSEHISYKSSTKWLEELPVEGDQVIIGAGEENAGVIGISDDLAIVLKMESHNHPTAVNPAEAAVGVGNVFRDVMAMGAKPIAHLNVLRFGNLNRKETRNNVARVVESLGNYSNKFGVPVAGGEILFHESYAFNPLLNLMTVGTVRRDRVITASFRQPGHKLVLVGRETSGTGVHGAGFASSALTRQYERLVPESQLADPHAGRVLFDFISELNENSLICSMQDVGAGGVLCAASEMAFRGKTGVEVSLDQIPLARENMAPIDILLSQSQEQMLISVEEKHMEDLRRIADKWSVNCTPAGEVRSGNRITVRFRGETLGDLPVASLVRGGGAPVYIRNVKVPARKVVSISADSVPYPGNLKDLAKQMIRLPNIASRKWIYEQFDTSVGLANLSQDFDSDAGILRLLGNHQLLAVSVDGNSRYIRMEPRKGTQIAVAEAVRNIVCSGGKPIALVNGMNFGDPADQDVYYDFTECIRGLKQACLQMNIPVAGGNVSFNNLTRNGEETVSVQPTPIIGLVGTIEDADHVMSISFRSKGDMIYLVGESDNDISGSEYLARFHLVDHSAAPRFDMERELNIHRVVSGLIRKRLIASAHDVSLGGLFVALVECALRNNLGFDITSPAEVRADAFLFNESQGRIIVSVKPEKETEFIDFMMESGVPFSALGHITKEELRVDDTSYGFIDDYAREFEHSLGNLLTSEENNE